MFEAASARHRAERRFGAEMPLAGHHGAIAGVAQAFGDGGRPIGEVALVARLAGLLRRADFHHRAHAHLVVVAAGHQHGAGGRTQGRGVEVGQAHAARDQRVEVGRIGLATKTGEVGPAHVVDHDDEEIWAFVALCVVHLAYRSYRVMADCLADINRSGRAACAPPGACLKSRFPVPDRARPSRTPARSPAAGCSARPGRLRRHRARPALRRSGGRCSARCRAGCWWRQPR